MGYKVAGIPQITKKPVPARPQSPTSKPLTHVCPGFECGTFSMIVVIN